MLAMVTSKEASKGSWVAAMKCKNVRPDGPVAVNLRALFQACVCWSRANMMCIGGDAATAGSIFNLRKSFWA